MKKYLMSVALVFALVGTTFAQLTINPKIGVNFYDISDTDGEIIPDGKTGFHGGVDFRIGDKVFVQPGIHYYALSADFQNDGLVDRIEDDVRLQNVRIPVLVGTSFLQTDQFKLRANIGLVGLFPIATNDNLIFDADDYRNVNFGAATGVGMDLGRLTLDIMYDFGLTDTFEDTSNFSGRGNVLSLSVGIAL
ncbi:MAG: porin family protein [Bacteroidota bacterium]